MDQNKQFIVLLVIFLLVILSIMFVTRKENYTLSELVRLATPVPFDTQYLGSVGGFGTKGCVSSEKCSQEQERMAEKPCCTSSFFDTPKTLGGMKCNCSATAASILGLEGFRFNPDSTNERRPMTRPIDKEQIDTTVLLNLNPVCGNTFQNFEIDKYTDCKTCNNSIYSVNNKTPLSYFSIDRSRS